MNKDEKLHAHCHSNRHRAEILSSRVCGCFYCLRTFPSCNIREWCDPGQWDCSDPTRPVLRKSDRRQTALCPCCGIDSVLGDFSGFPITTEFLQEMNETWFSSYVNLRKRYEEESSMKEEVP